MPEGTHDVKIFDTCVIGVGGVVGSAIVRELSRRGLTVLGLEKHDGPAQETSGLNSRVIHSGFHEAPGTLKARLAFHGSRMLIDYAARNGIPLLKTGMLIAIPRQAMRSGLWREVGSLWQLWRSGRTHHIEFRWILSSAGVRRIAPIDAAGGIFIPSVCVADVMQFIKSLQRESIQLGAELNYSCAATAIDKGREHYRITTNRGDFSARNLINSAGLSAASISRMAGGPDYSVEYFRGEYYELRGGIDRWGIRTLVYPAMPSGSRSKGIHFGPRTDGRLVIGPDSANVESPPTPKSVFLDAARRFIPSVSDDDLEYSCAGVRPKCGSDFVIRVEGSPPLINLVGIDSPGLSASMAIGEHVAQLLVAAVDDRRPRIA